MKILKKKFVELPSNILVIGGGRWSRVIIQALCKITHPSVNIYVYSPHNASGMSEWIIQQNIRQSVRVSAYFPENLPKGLTAVVVVNAVRDHEKSIEWALNSGFPVLVEKPISLTYCSSKRLADIAGKNNILLASAHIFLFAGYIEKFARKVLSSGIIETIQVQWIDPNFESRYGELKKYDSSIPVFTDWLPHILSIIGRFAPETPSVCDKLQFQKGGSEIIIHLKMGNIPCEIIMIRNGDQRKRQFDVSVGGKLIKLDFSKEPGTMYINERNECRDLKWNYKERPSELLLRTFLKAASGKEFDERLNIEIGLKANKVIDEINAIYQPLQIKWLLENLTYKVQPDEHLKYALTELLQIASPINENEIERLINKVITQLSRASGSHILKKLNITKDPRVLLEIIPK